MTEIVVRLLNGSLAGFQTVVSFQKGLMVGSLMVVGFQTIMSFQMVVSFQEAFLVGFQMQLKSSRLDSCAAQFGAPTVSFQKGSLAGVLMVVSFQMIVSFQMAVSFHKGYLAGSQMVVRFQKVSWQAP